MLELNIVDIAVAGILLLYLIQGLSRGLVREVCSLVGVVGGLVLAKRFQFNVQPSMEPLFSDPNVAGIAAFMLIFVFSNVAVGFIGIGVRKILNVALTPMTDRLLGGLFSMCKGVCLLCLVYFIVQGLFPDLELLKTAKATPYLRDLTAYLTSLLPSAYTYKLPSLKL